MQNTFDTQSIATCTPYQLLADQPSTQAPLVVAVASSSTSASQSQPQSQLLSPPTGSYAPNTNAAFPNAGVTSYPNPNPYGATANMHGYADPRFCQHQQQPSADSFTTAIMSIFRIPSARPNNNATASGQGMPYNGQLSPERREVEVVLVEETPEMKAQRRALLFRAAQIWSGCVTFFMLLFVVGIIMMTSLSSPIGVALFVVGLLGLVALVVGAMVWLKRNGYPPCPNSIFNC